jgi:predicted permease
MRPLRAFLLRFVALFTKQLKEQEFTAELESHLRLHIEENVRAGMSLPEARRQALIKLGGIEPIKETYRERRGLPLLETLYQDLRFGARMLRKNPGFTTLAVLTLALGIGANTAIFSIVNAVFLRPLPYKNSARLITVHCKTAMFPAFTLGISWPALQAIRQQAHALEDVSAYSTSQKTLTGRDEPAVLRVAALSANFFTQLGTEPQLGRLLSGDDQRAGQDLVAVISDRLWRARFAADNSVIGQKLILDQQVYTVVGVTARNFTYPNRTDVWLPLALTPEMEQNLLAFNLQVIGTLREGQALSRLRSQLEIIAGAFPKQMPRLGKDFKLLAEPLLENAVGDAREAYLALFGATVFVLMIACANLTSLLLARGWGRNREMAVRAALGASRSRLQRQSLVESCLLALLGGALGISVAGLGVTAFCVMAPLGTPRLNEITIDWTLLWFALGSSLLAGLGFGLVPSRRASRIAPIEILKEGGAGSVGDFSKFGNILVILEVAMAFVLLAGSTLMVQTLAHLLRQNPGFHVDHLLTFDLPQSSASKDQDMDALATRRIERIKQISAEVRRLPGVDEVAAADHGVLTGMRYMHSGLELEGATSTDESAFDQNVIASIVAPGYFHILGVPLVRGREFDDRDAKGSARVIIVNESMARKYWGRLDVLGKHISLTSKGSGKKQDWNEIVGVAADVRDLDIQSKAEPEVFLALLQQTSGSYHLLVRTQSDPDALATVISRTIWASYPDQPVTHVSTLRQTISESVGDQRMYTILLGIFAAIGLSLALLGIYGVISYSVTRRTQEIGVRVALGARSADVLRMIMLRGVALIGVGAAIGLVTALMTTRLIAGQLYGVKPNDPVTLVIAILLISIVGSLACWMPARRAMRVDPIVALRYE